MDKEKGKMMNTKTWLVNLCAGSVIVLSACAPEPQPTPQIIYAEPVFNKFGNPSCRPGDVPIGGAYTAELPLCSIIASEPVAAVIVPVVDENGDDGTVVVPDIPGDDPTGGNQNENQNQNQNENQNQSNEQSGGS
jgi:hypothetical protein